VGSTNETGAMTPATSSELINRVWQYPLFEALYGRRSRRFGLGFEIAEGPFRYKSEHTPLPLSELEEALLVAAGVGVTGAPLWDMGRPAAFRAGPGRTYASTSRGRRTALFFTNDHGVYVIDPANPTNTKVREAATPDEQKSILALYRGYRKELRRGRLAVPRKIPPLFGHNLWDSNMPGATLFMPICDVSQTMIALLVQLVDGDVGRFVGKHGGGMYIVDDRHGFRPAGNEKWANRGFLDRKKVLPLSILERQACYFMFSEPAAICHNISLAAEAIGLGGWMHCGFLSLEVLRTLGFTMVEIRGAPSANPVGLDGVFQGFCPPYFPDMGAAVDAVVSGLLRKGTASTTVPTVQGAAPYRMSDANYLGSIAEISDEGIACVKAVCNYVYETYGRFPGNVDTMHLMWFMQVHHLDLDFYDKFFHAGVCGCSHATHMATWHA
jgi:hypothetical protein